MWIGFCMLLFFSRRCTTISTKELLINDEIKAKEEADKMEELQSKYDALLKESTISKYKARFLALGYEDALATEAAEAMANGDTEKVFAAQQKNLDAVEKKFNEEFVGKTPRPTGGSGKGKSAEDILNITDSAERQSAIAENIDLFQ